MRGFLILTVCFEGDCNTTAPCPSLPFHDMNGVSYCAYPRSSSSPPEAEKQCIYSTADWISKPQTCPRSFPSLRWSPLGFGIVAETWLKQQAVSLTSDDCSSDLLPMPCSTPPPPRLLSRSGPGLGFHSCHWEEGGFEWSLFLSYPPGVFLLLPEHQPSIWRPGCGERGSTSQSWKNFKGICTTGTGAFGRSFIALQWFQMRKEAMVLSHRNSPLSCRR